MRHFGVLGVSRLLRIVHTNVRHFGVFFGSLAATPLSICLKLLTDEQDERVSATSLKLNFLTGSSLETRKLDDRPGCPQTTAISANVVGLSLFVCTRFD